ncbi:MAG: YebC/PmpR family DNA-binding transcriptional regulator, partial [Bacteroidota bacterium]
LSFMFDRKGIFIVPAGEMDQDELEMELIDAGAEDIDIEENSLFHITTSLEDFGAMAKKLEDLKLEPESAELQRIPTDTKSLSLEDSLKIMKVIDLFEDDDDVQNVFHNLEITDELMEAL